MKYLNLVGLVLLAAICILPGYGQESVRLKVIVDDAKVNETPEISSNALARLALDTIVIAEEKQGEWYKVTVENEGVKIEGFMHEMLVTMVTEEELAEEQLSTLFVKSQEEILSEIETILEDNRDRIRQDTDLEQAIQSLNPLIARAFRISDNKKQKELATEIFLWMGLGYAGQKKHKMAMNAFRSMFEVENQYAKEITRNIYDTEIVFLIQHAESEYLGEPAAYSIEIVTNPDKATVRLNGEEVGQSSGVFQTDSPVVQVEIEKEGHASLQDEVYITKEMQRVQYQLEQLGRNIVITTRPTGAKVFIDGQDTGEMTNCILSYMVFGEHKIKFQKENYQEWEEEIFLEKSAVPYYIEAVLAPANYRFLNKWGGPKSSVLEKPVAITLDKDNNMYVLDVSREKVKKFDPEGKPLRGLKLHGQRYKGIKAPGDIAIDSEGYIYVTDVKEHCVWKFNSKGAFIKRWGKEGNQKNEFLRPRGIAANDKNLIFVADSGNSRVKIYSSMGDLIEIWDKPGNIALPIDIAFNTNNDVFILDKQKAYWFSPRGELVSSWGGHGKNEGEFRNPSGICVDSDNYIYVADTLNSRIQKLDATGNFVTQWGAPGLEEGKFNTPSDVVVDSRGYVYVVDTDNNRVQIFSVPSASEE